MNQQIPQDQFEALLPLAAGWAAEQETWILREGVPLSHTEMIDAQAVGVKAPDRVRLLQVEKIPSPTHPLLKAACNAINFFTAGPRGLTFHYGIFVRRDCAQDRHLLIHELVHTAQYERLGGINPFLRKYLSECFTNGYHNSPLEQEAADIAQRICA